MAKRLQNEIRQFQTNEVNWCSISLKNDNMYMLTAEIVGPENSPYEAGKFLLDLEVPTEYPFKPPKIKYATKVYHPNIKDDGTVCTAHLQEHWSPQMKLQDVLMTMRQLLGEPNINDPLEPAICEEYTKNKPEFERKARDWTRRYAIPHTPAAGSTTSTTTTSTTTPAPTTPAPTATTSTTNTDNSATSKPATGEAKEEKKKKRFGLF
eukprot:TRINITY_DN106_c0_g1_i1.p1 TRINITY_DN106_c0_g1~~TRINITY_DN106_c0_g1_i1.p1  ORF type:complete len:208 (+),score=123.02 TRINITY_DN106_c0_g1_i1:135-758(+)